MRDFLIKMLASKLGINSIPTSQKEFFNMVANSPEFKNDLQRAESLGLIRRDNATGDYIVNADKADGLMKQFASSLF